MMHNKLLVVLSNYNGYRESLNLKVPRYKVIVDSFISVVRYYKDLNVLLLDNNSTDGSEQIIEEYIEKVGSPKWNAKIKTTEDFYLGSLYCLVDEYGDKYDYLMVVDNDQFFYQKRDFLTESITFLENNPDCVVFQLNTPTYEDFLDHYYLKQNLLDRLLGRKLKVVVGIFDDYRYTDKGILMLRAISMQHLEGAEFITIIPRDRGTAIFRYPGYIRKRVSWLFWSSMNGIYRVKTLKNIFEDPTLQLPYSKNSDRLALFASKVGEQGNTWYFQHGASINFGFRKHAIKKKNLVDVVKLIERYRNQPQESVFTMNGFSFFVKDKKVFPDIESILSKDSS